MKVFCDMDGVLADFVGGACKVHNRTAYDKPEHNGVWDVEKLWGMSPNEFWKPTNNFNFWANLNKTPEADEIVRLTTELVGFENVAILTSPSLYELCIAAKRAWLDKYYPGLSKRMICAYDKSFLAGPGRVLIDDRDRNIEQFEADGGRTIIVPRPWNKAYEAAAAGLTLLSVKSRLNTIPVIINCVAYNNQGGSGNA